MSSRRTPHVLPNSPSAHKLELKEEEKVVMFVGNRKEKENNQKSICSKSSSVCAPYATGLKSRISSTRLSPFSSV